MKSILLPLLALQHVCSFVPIASIPNRCSLSIASTKGKGFGPQKPLKPEKKSEEKEESGNEVSEKEVNANNALSIFDEKPKSSKLLSPLKELRRQEAEKKDASLRKVKELREMDVSVAESAPSIPEKVAMRMGQRMVPFVGIPLFLGVGSFVTFWYLATYKDMQFQPVSVAFTTIAILGVSLLGITYSIFSTSWDEDRDGGALGVGEAKKNLENVKAGIVRTSQNAEIRDKLARMPEGEIERQIADLDRRDAKKQKMD